MPNVTRTSPSGAGPSGEGDYEVAQGDCILSIAKAHGLFWETLWHDPENAELRRIRGDANKLLPGDRLSIPPLRDSPSAAADGKRHRFRMKGIPAMLNLRFVRMEAEPPPPPVSAPDPDALHAVYEDPEAQPPPEPKPRAKVPYQLIVDGAVTEGKTDGDGRVSEPLDPAARDAEIVFDPGTEDETRIPLRLGGLDPVDEPSGLQQRLGNLGFAVSEAPEDLAEALAEFQASRGLEPTGELDAATRDELVSAHGE
jgi:hypothetical protein